MLINRKHDTVSLIYSIYPMYTYIAVSDGKTEIMNVYKEKQTQDIIYNANYLKTAVNDPFPTGVTTDLLCV